MRWLGGKVMFYFRASAAAVLAAVEMVEVVGRQGLPPAHVGVHAGPAVFAEYARPGKVLVSQEVVGEIGPVGLKGVSARSGSTPPATSDFPVPHLRPYGQDGRETSTSADQPAATPSWAAGRRAR